MKFFTNLLTLLATFNPTIYAQLNTSAVANLTLMPEYKCWGRETFRPTRNGPPRDCAKAVMAGFPSSPDRGTFYQGPNSREPFCLPKTSSEGFCTVSVDLNGKGNVQGSWMDIWTMAATLNAGCMYWRTSDPSSAVTGGNIKGGQLNGLTLTMGWPGRMGNDNSGAEAE